jgi:hypothetical protein
MGQRQKQHMGRSAGDESVAAGRDIPDEGLESRTEELREASGGRHPEVGRGEPNAETEALPRDAEGEAALDDDEER